MIEENSLEEGMSKVSEEEKQQQDQPNLVKFYQSILTLTKIANRV